MPAKPKGLKIKEIWAIEFDINCPAKSFDIYQDPVVSSDRVFLCLDHSSPPNRRERFDICLQVLDED
jgi:hypothetical protein